MVKRFCQKSSCAKLVNEPFVYCDDCVHEETMKKAKEEQEYVHNEKQVYITKSHAWYKVGEIYNVKEANHYTDEYWTTNDFQNEQRFILKNHCRVLTEKEQEDVINTPSHYHKGGIDVIGFAEAHYTKEELKGFFRINVNKYVDRYDKKNGLQDLEKAQFYLKKLIELES